MVLINVKKVTGVLLQNGDWHKVDESFDVGGYQFTGFGAGKDVILDQERAATWKGKKDERYVCPLTAILAFRVKD